MIRPLVTGPWKLDHVAEPDQDAPTVFSCFACGGGSSMGYRLAGFRNLGYCEIDPEMSNLYDWNLGAKHRFKIPIQDFKNRALNESEADLYKLDVLDGSPPCSSFSMAGARERDWGKKKMFREGQTKQVLDDLFFHFIDVAAWLSPKFVVAENVKGLLAGNAKGYVKEIFQRFRKASYIPQLFLLNSSRMGVPQARERTFFLARREDQPVHPMMLRFEERPIPMIEAIRGADTSDGKRLSPAVLNAWTSTKLGSASEKYFQLVRPHPMRPSPTITAQAQNTAATVVHPFEPRKFSTGELRRLQTFPQDYDFLDVNAGYVMGMSVPPLMMQRVATEVYRQWILPAREHAKASCGTGQGS